MTSPRRTAAGGAPHTPGALASLYRLMLDSQVTRARVLSLGALGLVSVLVGLAIGHSNTIDPLRAGTRFVSNFGLSVLVPVATLVFASAALGDPNEDGTLVYLWLRPVARWKIVVAAALASFTVTWPIVTIPLVLAAALSRGGGSLVGGTVAGVTVATIGYVGLFVALGLRVKRALVWGLLYIFIWEGFVASANNTAARLAIRSYGRSTLTSITGQSFRFSQISGPWSWLVPVGVCLVSLAYATWRLSHQDIA
jgi:ABC-2 type transport system permease protein